MSLSTKLTLANGLVVDQPTGLFINGEFVAAKSGKTFETVNPTTEEVICAVSEADEADVNAAVDAAHAAFRTWGFKTAPSDRAAVLFKLADLIERDLDIIAALETTDNGKVYAHAKGDVALVCKVIRYYAGYADKIYGDVIHGNDGHFSYTRKEPIGVCGQIIPWNFPLVMWSWKIAPALATGNTVVLKSAESTPLSALYAAKLAQEAGLPAGVLNILSGYGQVGALMTNHPKIRKVAFTGSTATGKQVLKSAALSNLKKISLELGGKSPNIIFDDANLPNAISWAALGIFFNSGEVCAAASRLYVQEGVYDEVVAALKTRAEALVVGDPFDQKTFQGAQTSKLQFDRVMSFIEAGKAEGATLLTGGCRAQDKGYFIRPTVFTDVKKDMKIVQEEIFGPVVVVTKFKTLEEVIELANDSEYGLAAGVHTQDISRAHYLAENLHAGTVWVNTYNSFHIALPFGGFNQSGFGKEMGKDGLDSYIQTKAVRIMFDQAKLQ